jgi:hypothetical protein
MRPNYPERIGSPLLTLQDRAFRIHDKSCDVLIYGDSSAAVGVDPRVIKAETGLSACNIAMTQPLVDDLGTLPLDAFLKNNPHPKFLVFQFSPEFFYRVPNPWENGTPLFAMSMLLRDTPLHFAIGMMVRHPAETTQFMLYSVQKELFPDDKDEVKRRTAIYFKTIAESIANDGLLTLYEPPLSACQTGPPRAFGQGHVDARWVQQLRQKYEAFGITVIFKASPIPECDTRFMQLHTDLAPYLDSNVQTMPIEVFLRGERHTTTEGARLETRRLAQLIKSNQQR